MPLRRDPSRALQFGFLALLVLSVLTVGWWIADHVPYFGEVQRRFESLYTANAEAVNAVYDGASPEELQPLLPHLVIDPAARHARVHPQALARLEDETSRRINRFLWEGGFFLVVLLGGMTVLTRSIRHDRELRRRQQNFLAAVSHEFKSPLASVRLAAETLVLRSKEPDSQRLGRRILEDGERLLRMVDNLLDTARLEEGRARLAPKETSLSDAARAGAEDVSERASAQHIDIMIDVPEDLRVSVDPNALDTMLRNLLDNSIKSCAAGNGRSIQIRARRGAEGVTLEVEDDGLGFPPEDAAMIFEKFHRLGNELRRTTAGTGLGLYIVKRLVDLSGARISASSPGPGRGAKVTIVWPA
jgi:signal transduction histidine kinase